MSKRKRKHKHEPPAPTAPVIVICSWNRVDLLKTCLQAIFANTRHPYTVCVVDQGSTDGTKAYLESLGDRVDHVAVASNLGFVHGNNLAMERHADRDVVLLNNDTEVQPGWLEALMAVRTGDPKVGIVGSKLVFPDGRLQSAGGEVFADASAREIGKNDDPERWIYNQIADVDYCSGACMLITREVREAVGCFDPRFAPAYWEDTDLCFAARKAGFRVVYAPQSVVVHHEGGSFGNPQAHSRSAELQARNKPKFIAKWVDELEKQRSSVFAVPAVAGKPKLLVILPFPVLYDRAAGERNWLCTLEMLAKRYQIVLLARNGVDATRYINRLESMGITVFHTDTARMAQLGHAVRGPLWIDLPALLTHNDFKGILVSFYHVLSQYYDEIRRFAPEVPLVVHTGDVHFLREERKARVADDPQALWHAEEVRRVELAWYRKCDVVLAVTEKEAAFLRQTDPELHVEVMPDIHPLPEWQPPADDAKDLLFVGNFNHDPNEDAVLHFVEAIWPRIRAELPDVKLTILGNNPTPKVQRLAGTHVRVTGYVPEVLPFLRSHRVGVVPLRYGAGVKGKVAEAMAAGLPQVITPIAAEGIGCVHDQHVLIAEDDDAFARQVVRLYRDAELRRRLAENGRDLAAARFSVEHAERCWQPVFDRFEGKKTAAACPPADPSAALRSAAEARGFTWLERRPQLVPKYSIVIPVHENLDATRACWTSLRKYTSIPHEIVLVDNGSLEPVALEAEQNNLRCLRLPENRGFAAAVNHGIRHSFGEVVVVLNNDTIVTPGWLEKIDAHLQADPTIGVLAPQTNYANNPVQCLEVPYEDEIGLCRFSDALYGRHRGRRQEVAKVAGVCMAIPRSVVEAVGLFDTRFGLGNFEDDDYCLRVRLGGYRVVVAQDVFVHHVGGLTFKRLGVDYEALMRENADRYVRKWLPLVAAELQGTAPTSGGGHAADGRTAPRTRPARTTTPERGVAPTPSRVAPAGPTRTPASSAALTVLLVQDEDELALDGIESILGTLPSDANVRVVAPVSPVTTALGEAGIPIVAASWDAMRATLDAQIRELDSPWVLVLSTKVRADAGWLDALLEAADEHSDVALAVPEIGAPPAASRRGGEPALADETEPAGACVLVRRSAYLEAGGWSRELHSDAGWAELALRVEMTGRRIVRVRGVRVRCTPGTGRVTRLDAAERETVQTCREVARQLQEGDVEAAAAALARVTAEAKRPFLADYLEARLHLVRGDDAGARQRLETLRTRCPGQALVLNDLGCLAHAAGDPRAAREQFQAAVEANPYHRDARRNLAELLLAEGEIAAGLLEYQRVVALAPGDAQTFVELGAWYERLGDTEGARDLYRRARDLAPEHPEVRAAFEALCEPQAVGV